MSKPSFSNIDLWLFELSEGNLSKEQIAQLEIFLLQHPELDVDRDMWEMARVNSDPVVYSDVVERRRPIGVYSAVGSTLFILLTFVGCYQYFNLESINPSDGKFVASGNGNSNSREAALLNEIENLKADIQSLESENIRLSQTIDDNRNSQNRSSRNNEGQIHSSSYPTSLTNWTSQNGGNTISAANVQGTNVSVAANNTYRINGAPGSLTLTGQPVGIQTYGDYYYNEKSGITSDVRAYAPRTIEYDWYTGRGPFANDVASHAHPYKKEDIKISFKSKMNKMSRAIQRMMDNPIALKNSRDPHYHVPGMLAQDVNMGSAGTLLTTRVQTLSRIQWLGQENQQLMNQIAIDGYSYGIRGGLGLQLNHAMYKDGGINVANVALSYSPKFSVSKWISVEPAVRFKMGNKSLYQPAMEGVSAVEINRGNVYDYYADGNNPIGNDLWYKDIGAGLIVNTRWFFAGMQFDNILRHRDNIYSVDLDDPRRAGTHFVATIGTDWESRKENMSLSPYAVYQQNEALSELWLGANYRWGWFNIGAAVSDKMEPAGSIGLKFKHFAINYNVDYTNSVLSNHKSLSHQISLRFLGKTSRFGQRLLNH